MKNFKSEIRHWDADQQHRYIIGNIIHFGGLIMSGIAFLVLLGIIGHSDFCIEAGVVDTWTDFGYMLGGVISIVVMLIGMLAFDFGSRIRGYYFDFC